MRRAKEEIAKCDVVCSNFLRLCIFGNAGAKTGPMQHTKVN